MEENIEGMDETILSQEAQVKDVEGKDKGIGISNRIP